MFQQLSDRLNSTFKSLRTKGRLSEKDIEETVKEIRTALLEADVALNVANDFCEKIKTQWLDQENQTQRRKKNQYKNGQRH